ncbi:hypothetical protein PF011_g27555 [Phytophthora fragariae]|uniref:Pyridine nucleotide-disulphide oxidoreductase dimerisation domain-containing protein n=1 Tax=Phytophthora fragariae TaxID=53985 RepID=A0A6A3HFG9_9STRA|nr:hypothetical protein PF011_g27555 [Phytophthora fragariae]
MLWNFGGATPFSDGRTVYFECPYPSLGSDPSAPSCVIVQCVAWLFEDFIAGKIVHVNYGANPGIICTFSKFATVGKTEEELKAQDVDYNVGKFIMMENNRARAVAEADGLVKVLANKKMDRLPVLGVCIIARNAGEMIGEGVSGIEYSAVSEDLAGTCHAHPHAARGPASDNTELSLRHTDSDREQVALTTDADVNDLDKCRQSE